MIVYLSKEVMLSRSMILSTQPAVHSNIFKM
jgi:hypothetical protein